MADSGVLRAHLGGASYETSEARTRRIAREALDLAEARACVLAGRFVGSAKVKAWIDSIGTENELAAPTSES